jgi:2-furoyl-CoA dehydrogenase large subunit
MTFVQREEAARGLCFAPPKFPPVEGKRFVRGEGRFVGNVELPGMLHVALVSSPHSHALIKSIDADAVLALDGVHAVITGEELADSTKPLRQYLDVPNVRWYPLAVGKVRYEGEWVAAVVAESRYLAEDAAALVEVEYDSIACVLDPEEAMQDGTPLVHEDHGSNVMIRRSFAWGDVEKDFDLADERVSYRARWNRSSTVPLETFGVVASWHPGSNILDVWASIQMPQYPEQLAGALGTPLHNVRVHYDVDVGGSFGVKRGIKQTVLTAYASMKLSRPVRFLEDRLENMRGGDAHGPDRIFDVELAFDSDGRIHSMKMRTIDDEGAYPGRSPMQLGKPLTAIVGPYRIKSVQYEIVAVTTNKTAQVAVRGFGQSPTNFALECGVDRVAQILGLDTAEVRRRNFIAADQFPYTIPSGTTYDSGDYETVLDKALELADYDGLVALRKAVREEGRLAGVGLATCLEPSGGNAIFEPLLNPKNQKTTFPEGCRLRVDSHGNVTATIGFSSAGQSHETLVATLAGEELQRDPQTVRVVRADSLAGLPSQSPVASRMAIMVGGAIAGAAQRLKEKLVLIGAHNLGVQADDVLYDGGDVLLKNDPANRISWNELVEYAHRRFHCLPPDMEPGLEAQFVMQVPMGGRLPDVDGTVQLYPCVSLEAHLAFVVIDPETGEIDLRDYAVVHDCGTVLNPQVVQGLVVGGVAQGIGVALLEQYAYDGDGRLLSATFNDYLLPAIRDVPRVRLGEHTTPSPLTSLGQKGSGEAGYMGAPAVIASAVNDALSVFGTRIDTLPIRSADIWSKLRGARR